MPGATVAREADFMAPMAWKVFMMPQTVPNSPMNGAVFAEVARKDRELVRRVISMSTPCRSARRTLSTTTSSEFPASFERLNSVTPSWATVYSGESGSPPRDCTASRRSRAWLKRSMPSAAFLSAARMFIHLRNIRAQLNTLMKSRTTRTALATSVAWARRERMLKSITSHLGTSVFLGKTPQRRCRPGLLP